MEKVIKGALMPHENRMEVNVTPAEVKKFKLGDKVIVTAEGEITELLAKHPFGMPMAMGMKGEKAEDTPPSITIKVLKEKVKMKSKNLFTKMSEEDDNE
jgi:hypothetical protein